MGQLPLCPRPRLSSGPPGLAEVAQRLGARFSRSEPRRRARSYGEGLLRPVERKNGWPWAAQAGDPCPYGVPHLLGRAPWDADAGRDHRRAYVSEPLAAPAGVLMGDETGFLKKGDESVGVGVPRP